MRTRRSSKPAEKGHPALGVPASDLRRLVSWGPLAAAASEQVEQAIDDAEAVLRDGLRSPDLAFPVRVPARRHARVKAEEDPPFISNNLDRRSKGHNLDPTRIDQNLYITICLE